MSRRPGYLAGHQTFAQTSLKAWARALQSRNPRRITQLYAPDALLLATLDGDIKQGRAAIKQYFQNLVKKPGLRCIFQETFQISPNTWAGLYTFKWRGGELPARFTFVMGPEGIQHHHSSSLPNQK